MIAMSSHRRAFTLVEVVVVSAMTAFLAVLLSSTWAGINRSTIDLVGRGRLIQEMDMAIASLSRDFAGSLAIKSFYSYDPLNIPSDLGAENIGVWVGCRKNGDNLQLCFDGGDTPDGKPDWASPDTVVEYSLEPYTDSHDETSNVLVRQEYSNYPDTVASEFIVAKNVGSMVVDVSDLALIKIELTFKFHHSHGDYLRKCTLIARAPQ
jgi:hypothetical protein